jgi:hypothetical protein
MIVGVMTVKEPGKLVLNRGKLANVNLLPYSEVFSKSKHYSRN